VDEAFAARDALDDEFGVVTHENSHVIPL